jgi:virginiamycin B lyase
MRIAIAGFCLALLATDPLAAQTNQTYTGPDGAHPHDVAPASDGGVWYTAQGQGALGWLDPKTGRTVQIPLGAGSAPHGVIVGPDHAPWITDGGLNAIVRVDPDTRTVKLFKLPGNAPNANLNTAAFDRNGVLWFTGQSGFYGRLDPGSGKVDAWTAPRGYGPYGITVTPDGDIFYASLAGSHIAQIDPSSGKATVIEPPTPKQGARRVWTDSGGRVWVSEWNSGQVSVFDPRSKAWKSWKLPGADPATYAVYVDDQDKVWLTDFNANAILRFDPMTQKFASFPLPHAGGAARQILGRAGEIWVAESGADYLTVIRIR